MKFLIFILSLFTLICGNAQNDTISVTETILKIKQENISFKTSKIYSFSDTITPFTGYLCLYFDDKKENGYERVFRIKNGCADGDDSYFYRNGKIESKATLKRFQAKDEGFQYRSYLLLRNFASKKIMSILMAN